MPRGTAVLIAVALSLVPAAPGLAQDDGVTYDPDSPAGREYALPLERERQKHSSARKGDGRPAAPQLFGEGVERADATGAVSGGGSGSSGVGGSGSDSGPGASGPGSGGGSGSSPSGNGASASPAQTEFPPVERVVPAGTGGSGGSAGLLTAGLMAATALAIGALVRRRPGRR